MNDLEFVRRCVSKDKQAWDEFVEKYSRLIYNYIYTVLNNKGYRPNPEVVNDLYQEIFTALIKDDFKKLRQFKAKNGASLASWLRIITINFTLDFLRRQKPMLSLEETFLDKSLTLKERIADNSVLPAEELLSDKQRLEGLLDCMEQLNDEDKYFIDMHINRDVDLEDLRTILKISRSAVDMRKSRIIQRLRDCFKKKGFAIL